MHIDLPPDLSQLVNQKVSAGEYPSADKAVEAALRNMLAHEEWRKERVAALNREIDKGIESVKRGDVMTDVQWRAHCEEYERKFMRERNEKIHSNRSGQE